MEDLKVIFEKIYDDKDFMYKDPIQRARLFLKIYYAIVNTNKNNELIREIKKYNFVENIENYLNEYENAYNKNQFLWKISYIVKENTEIINKVIMLYLNTVKSIITNTSCINDFI